VFIGEEATESVPPPRRDQPLRPHRHARTVPPRQPHVLRAARHLAPQPVRPVPARAPGRARDPSAAAAPASTWPKEATSCSGWCAVFYAGTQSALVTLWDVSDSSTSVPWPASTVACARRATTREPPSGGP
jgi:hypothetical protein